MGMMYYKIWKDNYDFLRLGKDMRIRSKDLRGIFVRLGFKVDTIRFGIIIVLLYAYYPFKQVLIILMKFILVALE